MMVVLLKHTPMSSRQGAAGVCGGICDAVGV